MTLSSIFLQIPCNWRFLQNDCLQLLFRALTARLGDQGHLGLPPGGIQVVWRLPVSCITSWGWTRGPGGDVQLAAVSQRSLLLCKMFQGWGPTTHQERQSVCVRSSLSTSAVPWQHHRLHYAQPTALLRAIRIAIRVFFRLLSYV